MTDCFSYFDNVYYHSKDFPAAAIERLPAEVLHAIDKGNEDFFADIQQGLPRFYEVLTKKCSPVCLLERCFAGDERRPPGSLFCWGAESDGGLFLAGIPISMSPRYIRARKEEHLSCLPTELLGCYTKIAGMTLAEPKSFRMSGIDLPSSFSDWVGLAMDCEDNEIDRHALAKIERDFSGDDIRLFMKGSHDELIFLNFTRKDGILYHVKNKNFDDYRPIKSPVGKVLDHYFANAVSGFPELVELV